MTWIKQIWVLIYNLSMSNSRTFPGITEPSIIPLQAQAWKVKTSRKIKHFICQAISGCVATKQNLLSRRVGSMVAFGYGPNELSRRSFLHKFWYLFWRLKKEYLEQDQVCWIPWIIWLIWKAHNDNVFNGLNRAPEENLNSALKESSMVWGKS